MPMLTGHGHRDAALGGEDVAAHAVRICSARWRSDVDEHPASSTAISSPPIRLTVSPSRVPASSS